MTAFSIKNLPRVTWSMFLRRCFAWAQTRHGAITLEQLGLPVCLAIAYLHPTMLWSSEMPLDVRIFGVLVSVASAGIWFALGWRIYNLHPIAPIASLLLYLGGRAAHLVYAALGIGTPEGALTLVVSGLLVVLLGLSVFGTVERIRREHSGRRSDHLSSPMLWA